MLWLNEPSDWSQEDGKITIKSDPQTDFWRLTRHNFIADNGHLYYQEVSGDFTATVKITGDYNALYDQAGLMIRQDERVWMKCGIEYLEGVQQASAVVTREFSDWSVVPLTDNPKTIWFKVIRIGSAVEVSYSRDGADYHMIREAYLSDKESLQLGLLVAAPKGDGFQAVFEDFNVTQE